MIEWIGKWDKRKKCPFPHFWEHTVGSGHATLALRSDWQEQLRKCHEELGFKFVRFHGILSDDMGTLICNQEKPLYSFHNADKIFDFLVSLGMKPFVELSFMPNTLSSGGEIVFHYKANVTPPKSFGDWNNLVEKLVKHWVSRYGLREVSTWFFEVWNEPNLKAFWTGTQAQYFELYANTARTIKAVSPRLQVGGPATAANAWIPEFVKYCREDRVPVDFVSTHHYPTDAFGKEGDDTVTQLSLSTPSILKTQATQASHEAAPLPVYYTEWSTSSNPRDELHDEPYAAAFIIKTILEARGLVKAYSYWTFSDIFEENYFPSVPFHGGFGLLNLHGIAKPAYRAYEILHSLGDTWVPLGGSHETVSAWAVRTSDSLTVVAVNFALPRHPLQAEISRFCFLGVPALGSASVVRIDEKNANAKALWLKMKSPEYPSPSEVARLKRASLLIAKPQKFIQKGEALSFTMNLPPLGVAAATFRMKSVTGQKSRKRKR
jgi:xylan 1,4-beta-xylosidase